MNENETLTTSSSNTQEEWVPYSFNGMTESRYLTPEVQDRLDMRIGAGNHRFDPPEEGVVGKVEVKKFALDAMREKMEK